MAKVERINDALVELGLDVFFDVQKLELGSDFPTALDRAIKSAKCVLACWSPTSLSRSWVMRECRVALERNVLLPVAIEKLQPLVIPTEFFGVNYLDLVGVDDPTDHRNWNALLRTVAARIGQFETPGAASVETGVASNQEDEWTDEDFPISDGDEGSDDLFVASENQVVEFYRRCDPKAHLFDEEQYQQTEPGWRILLEMWFNARRVHDLTDYELFLAQKAIHSVRDETGAVFEAAIARREIAEWIVEVRGTLA